MAEARVIERPHDFVVEKPNQPYTLIHPFEFYDDSTKTDRVALIILNQPITETNLIQLWNNSELQVCADGGANQLYSYFTDEEQRLRYIPQFIIGDLDSLTEPVKQYYESKGSRVIAQTSQYSTDFTKAIRLVQLYFHSATVQNIVQSDAIDPVDGIAQLLDVHGAGNDGGIRFNVLSAIGGRFDQTVHTINQLYTLNLQFPQLLFYFITESDVIFLVKKGCNYIAYPSKSTFHSKTMPICGLLPLGGDVVLNTKGLRWDVENWPSGMKGNVSSNNGVMGTNGFIVDTTDDIVMNIEIDQ